jgi:hypothetical protein
MVLAGRRAGVLNGIAFAAQAIPAGLLGLFQYARSLSQGIKVPARWNAVAIFLPLFALLLFSTLFVLANPELLSAVSQRLEQLLTIVRERLLHYAPTPPEMIFWVAVLWAAAGLLRPVLRLPGMTERTSDIPLQEVARKYASVTPYVAYRNTLLAVIVLFAAYLVFEFATLWFREFPPGFHYSGYAHEGAAWLTVALAVATLFLSLIFHGSVLHDPRLPRLRRLAWIWSTENLLLAVAVFHRLHIYIGFNGLSPMRMVGIYGITAVVVGFLLVVYKIARTRSFAWLLHRQLAALAVMVYLFVVTPVDWLVTSYNVQQIRAGDPAPCVQLSVRPIDAEGLPSLLQLLDCKDPIIRDGVKALLAEQQASAERQAVESKSLGWTTTQLAERALLKKLRAHESEWKAYDDPKLRQATLDAFHEYAYQWY